jgi:hypothetical protein
MDQGPGGVLHLFLRLLRRFKVPGSVSTIGLRWQEVVMRRLDSNPLILGPLFRLVADRCGDLAFPAITHVDGCGRLVFVHASLSDRKVSK